ncbi:hypothetical protein [Streptomyces sp. NPDC098781]|uniref:hypothetical protein n=1 Tax=Streptomyces sp. NPDC098781 TaxID=3366097 RepID=UPI0037F65C87
MGGTQGALVLGGPVVEPVDAGGVAAGRVVLGGPGVPRDLRPALADGALEGKALPLGTTRDEATATTRGAGGVTGPPLHDHAALHDHAR